MSILSWLKTVTHSNNTSELIQSETLTFAEGEEEFQGLNMKDALEAHTQWTHRLEAKINGTSREELEVATVACDDKCKLGKWIHGVAADQFASMEEFEELKRIHADFHLTAGEVLNNVTNGDDEAAQSELKKVRHKSGNVQLALVRLYSHVH